MTAIFGHRGCTEGWVENTVEAFEAARRVGADGVEFDVRRSADGVLVIHHDAEVDGLGLIAATPAADLPAHVPTLSAALEACRGLQMNVEIKNKPGDPGYDPSGKLSEAVAAALAENGRLEDVIVSSFDAPTIEAVRAVQPSLRIGWLLGGLADLPSATERAAERRYQAIHPFFAGVDAVVVERCHERGLAVNVWTPNAEADIEAMFDAGVDTLITDRLSDALAIAARREAETGG